MPGARAPEPFEYARAGARRHTPKVMFGEDRERVWSLVARGGTGWEDRMVRIRSLGERPPDRAAGLGGARGASRGAHGNVPADARRAARVGRGVTLHSKTDL